MFKEINEKNDFISEKNKCFILLYNLLSLVF